ncbi:hypothetical protein EFW17_00310 [Halostreptopolyspora alba]|uniref:Calpain catalytic domain-containing protein n=2 Tax=Halostreptopolyspora alba TaxID=2487137 RepID=A0A3N0EIU7_9ACTN|nr:hypothetical protein EFW17_00310 [Nocardiopsaceae bacterium YIM 96095]
MIVSAVVAAVLMAGVPQRIDDLITSGLARALGPSDPGTGSNADPGEQYWNQSDPDSSPATEPEHVTDPNHPDYEGPPAGHPAGPPAPSNAGPDPADADSEAVEAAVEELEGCLSDWNEDAPWFTGTCAYDTYKDLSPEELAAVVDTMSSQDLGRLFESGPIPLEQEYFDLVEEIQRTAPLDTLRALQNSGATPFAQPDFEGVGGDPAGGNSPSNVSYGEIDDYSLYGEGDEPVSWEHVNQNSLGDCWLMATMGAMARQNPGHVEEMIQENANGTYTVTFPGKDPVTVTPDLPLNPDGTPAFAGSNEDPPVIWPAIVEKAYADLEGNDYSNLENWHAGAAMNTFAGGAGMDYIPDVTDTTMDELAGKFENGEAITLSTPPTMQLNDWPKDGTGKGDLVDDDAGTLVSGHVYFMTGVNRDDGTVTLRNPWGSHTDDIVLSLDEVNDNFAAIHSTNLDE